MFSMPHRRLNALTGERVLVSPHRTARPWQGQVEAGTVERRPSYDPACYLCPGNERAGGARTPEYSATFIFDNDFAALKPGTAQEQFDRSGLLVADSEGGICRVVCQNGQFVALVPFWAVWPFETLVLPRSHHGTCLTCPAANATGSLTSCGG